MLLFHPGQRTAQGGQPRSADCLRLLGWAHYQQGKLLARQPPLDRERLRSAEGPYTEAVQALKELAGRFPEPEHRHLLALAHTGLGLNWYK